MLKSPHWIFKFIIQRYLDNFLFLSFNWSEPGRDIQNRGLSRKLKCPQWVSRLSELDLGYPIQEFTAEGTFTTGYSIGLHKMVDFKIHKSKVLSSVYISLWFIMMKKLFLLKCRLYFCLTLNCSGYVRRRTECWNVARERASSTSTGGT